MYLDVKLASDLEIVVPSPNRKNGFLYTNQFDKIYIPVVEYIEKELETPFNNRIAVLNAGMGSGKTYMGPFEFLPVGIRKAQILGLWGLWLFTAPDTTINDGTINDLESALDDCGVNYWTIESFKDLRELSKNGKLKLLERTNTQIVLVTHINDVWQNQKYIFEKGDYDRPEVLGSFVAEIHKGLGMGFAPKDVTGEFIEDQCEKLYRNQIGYQGNMCKTAGLYALMNLKPRFVLGDTGTLTKFMTSSNEEECGLYHNVVSDYKPQVEELPYLQKVDYFQLTNGTVQKVLEESVRRYWAKNAFIKKLHKKLYKLEPELSLELNKNCTPKLCMMIKGDREKVNPNSLKPEQILEIIKNYQCQIQVDEIITVDDSGCITENGKNKIQLLDGFQDAEINDQNNNDNEDFIKELNDPINSLGIAIFCDKGSMGISILQLMMVAVLRDMGCSKVTGSEDIVEAEKQTVFRGNRSPLHLEEFIKRLLLGFPFVKPAVWELVRQIILVTNGINYWIPKSSVHLLNAIEGDSGLRESLPSEEKYKELIDKHFEDGKVLYQEKLEGWRKEEHKKNIQTPSGQPYDLSYQKHKKDICYFAEIGQCHCKDDFVTLPEVTSEQYKMTMPERIENYFRNVLVQDHIDGKKDEDGNLNDNPEQLKTMCANRHNDKTSRNQDYLNSYSVKKEELEELVIK